MDTGTPAFTADCGHVIPALPSGHCGGTGCGTTGEGKKFCYACCAQQERASMIERGQTVLYLVRNDKGDWDITDWSGELRFPVKAAEMSHSHGYGFGRRYDIVTGRFRGPDGALWSFRNAGDNQIARCRRIKGIARGVIQS